MLNSQDENFMIDYVFGSLEESEELAFSERRTRDPLFDRYYRLILNALRPILEARTDESEQNRSRRGSKNLSSRTMLFIRNAVSQKTESSERPATTADPAANQTTMSLNFTDAMNETISEKHCVAIREENESIAEKK